MKLCKCWFLKQKYKKHKHSRSLQIKKSMQISNVKKEAHSKRKQFRMAKNLLSSEIFITWTVTWEIKKQVVVVVSLESAVQVSDGVSHKRSDILDLLLLINHHNIWIIVHEILISNWSDIQITRSDRFTLRREHWKKSKRRLGTVNVDQWCDLTGFVKLREASLPWEKFLEHGQACQTTSGSMCLVNRTVHSIKYHQHASVKDLRYIPFSKCVIFIYIIFTYVLRSDPQYS